MLTEGVAGRWRGSVRQTLCGEVESRGEKIALRGSQSLEIRVSAGKVVQYGDNINNRLG